MKKLTNEEVVWKLKDLYEDKFIYNKVNYVNSRSYIVLTCPIHGDFEVYANNALKGKAVCVKCINRTPSKEEFIAKSKEIHNNFYDYSKINYVNLSTRVNIICPIHGEFSILPRDHIKGNNSCPVCKKENTKKFKKMLEIKPTLEEKAIEKANKWKLKASEFHNNKYNYSLITKIYNLKDKVNIICPQHGEFVQQASIHLKHGCSKCAVELKKGKIKINTRRI